MENDSKMFRVTLATADVHAFLAHCQESQWIAVDTGERVMTDDGPDAETVLMVGPQGRQTTRARVAITH